MRRELLCLNRRFRRCIIRVTGGFPDGLFQAWREVLKRASDMTFTERLMKNRYTVPVGSFLAFFLLILLTQILFAHHGTATYDMANSITVKATITNFDWSNPHSQLRFDSVDDKGTVLHWNLECQPP